MDYVTKEKTPGTGFVMPIYLTTELEFPPSTSPFYCVIVWKEGHLVIQDKEELKVLPSPGVICIVPGHNISSMKFVSDETSKTDKPLFSLIFTPDGINTTFKGFPAEFEYKALEKTDISYTYKNINSGFSDLFFQLSSKIQSNLTQQNEYWPCLTRSYILEMLLLIERISYIENDFSIISIPTDNSKISEILQYIHVSYSEEITLDTLSKKFATNRTSLNNMFNTLCGTSAMSYIAEVRLQNASILLRNTALSVATIALRCGYTDESYFSKAFRKKVGKTPRDYRLSMPHPYGGTWQ